MMNKVKRNQKIILGAALTLFLSSCSVKDVNPTIHEEQIAEDAIIYKQQESTALTLMGKEIDEAELDRIETTVDKANKAELLAFVEETSTVFDAEHIQQYSRYLNYRSLFSLYNRAILNLLARIERNSKAADSVEKIAESYFATLFQGCDENYRGCRNYSFFAKDYNTAHILLTKAKLYEKQMDIAEYYQYLEFAYSIQNRSIDVQYALGYASRATEYGKYLMEKGLDERLETHRKIYEHILSTLKGEASDERVADFVQNVLARGFDQNVFSFEMPTVLEMAQEVVKHYPDRQNNFYQTIFSVSDETINEDPEVAKLFNKNLPYTAIMNQLYNQEIDSNKAYSLWELAGSDVEKAVEVAGEFINIKYFSMTNKVNELIGDFYSQKKSVLTKENLAEEFESYNNGTPRGAVVRFFERKEAIKSFLMKIEPELMTKDKYQDLVSLFSSYNFNAAIDIQLAQTLVLIYYGIKTQSKLYVFNPQDGKVYYGGKAEVTLRNIFEGITLEHIALKWSQYVNKGGFNQHDVLHSFERVVKNDLISSLTKINPEYNLKDFMKVTLETLLDPYRQRMDNVFIDYSAIIGSAEFKKVVNECQSGQFERGVLQQTLLGLKNQVYYSSNSDFYSKVNEFYVSKMTDSAGNDGTGDYFMGGENRIIEHQTIIGQAYGIAHLYQKVTDSGYDVDELAMLKNYRQSRTKTMKLVKDANAKLLSCHIKLYSKEQQLQYALIERFRNQLSIWHETLSEALNQIDGLIRNQKVADLDERIKHGIRGVLNVDDDLNLYDGASFDGINISSFGLAAMMKGFLNELAPELSIIVPNNIKNSSIYLQDNQNSVLSYTEDREEFLENALATISSKYLNWTTQNTFISLSRGLFLLLNADFISVYLSSDFDNVFDEDIDLIVDILDKNKELIRIKDQYIDQMRLAKFYTNYPEAQLKEFFIDPDTAKALHLYDRFLARSLSLATRSITKAKEVYSSYFNRTVTFADGSKPYDIVKEYLSNQVLARVRFIDQLIEKIHEKEVSDYAAGVSQQVVYELDSDFKPLKAIEIPYKSSSRSMIYMEELIEESYNNTLKAFINETNGTFDIGR